jgi:hypothetical protein
MPKNPGEPFQASLPFVVFAITAIPAVLGYLAGLEDR